MLLLKLIRIVLFAPLVLCRQTLTQFLLSPWGLIVPMTFLIALFALQYVHKTPEQLAQFYAERFETCTEAEIPPLINVLLRIGNPGVPGLVKGLSSAREPVFIACRNVLQYEFDRWENSPDREKQFLILADALLLSTRQFSPAAQAEALLFVEQMMQVRPDLPTPPETTVYREQTLARCAQILDQLASNRQKKDEPQNLDSSFQPDTVAALNRRTKQPVLLASNGLPFKSDSVRDSFGETLLADADPSNSYNTLSVPRAERLWAYQKSQPNGRAENRKDTPFLGENESLALASFMPPISSPATVEERFAQNFAAKNSDEKDSPNEPLVSVPDISESYRTGKLSESGGKLNSDSFLTPELQNTPPDRIPQLPTTQLMKLLHHPNLLHIESAQKTLSSRDGFQEVHLTLARRLYHPISAMRKEIVDMLPSIPNIQPSVWLSELLRDPHADVRYRAASFLATSNDPLLRRLLIDQGKRDNDERIVNLAERLGNLPK